MTSSARLLREELSGPADPLAAVRWLRGEPRPVALHGEWAGGGLVLGSHPVRVLAPDQDPFDALDCGKRERDGEGDGERDGEGDGKGSEAIGGGWFGWLGFGLARELEPVPPPPPRATPLPRFDLAFHDHVIRCDGDGNWWFEALWTRERAAVLGERLARWRARLSMPAPAPAPFEAGPLRVRAPGPEGHRAAVADVVTRIAEGDLSQANICLRLDAEISRGDPLECWLRGVAAARPAHAAYIGGEGHAVLSLSPELFLRRRGRTVETRPIKGTGTDPATLAASAKDRAENVMIVDLMRNDLGRVCEYGSVQVPELCAVKPAAGVVHLVSTVRGRLRPEVGDGGLLRATFPPGSVTGAPKVQALRMIHAVEPHAREAYCGAVGFASPVRGLELNVAIRTFEVLGERIWLGAGGGIVSDSSPGAETEEALAKAAGVAAATGIGIAIEAAPRPPTPLPSRVRLARPDPARGVYDTMLVRGGRPQQLAGHLARLRASCAELGLIAPGEPLIAEAAAALGAGGLRVVVDRAGYRFWSGPLPAGGPTRLEPVTLPGGLGAHKWFDRALVDALSTPGSTPLFCDLDGSVLEAGYAAVLIAVGETLVAGPLDGRRLPSVSRETTLRAARRAGLATEIRAFTVLDARGADAIVLASSLRGPHPGVLALGPAHDASAVICERLRSRWSSASEEEG